MRQAELLPGGRQQGQAGDAPQGFSSREGTSGLYLTIGNSTEAIETPGVNGYTMEVQDLSEAIRGEHAPRYALGAPGCHDARHRRLLCIVQNGPR